MGRADPRPQVVGRIEARVHVREVAVAAVDEAGSGAQALGVTLGAAAVLEEARPEVELIVKLCDVAAEEERFEEDDRLGVLRRLLVREVEVPRVPRGLERDRLADVRVDLRQRVVAGEPPVCVRQRRVDPGEMERVSRLVQEGLIVVEASLRTGD